MPRICILTDSTAQFTRVNFPGRERVFIIQMVTQAGSNGRESIQKLRPPSTQDYLRFYQHLSREYDAVLVLAVSGHINEAVRHAEEASRLFNDHAAIQVVDSQTTGAGLGMLVELAASALNNGASLFEVEQQVRGAISRVYMLICIPELSRLVGLGLLKPTQAVVGEMLGMMPVFVIEDGNLALMEKVRTPRHLFESFQEFMGEFTTPKQIVLQYGVNQNTLRTRPLRQFVQETFPGTVYSEYGLNQNLGIIFGNQCIALVVMDRI